MNQSFKDSCALAIAALTKAMTTNSTGEAMEAIADAAEETSAALNLLVVHIKATYNI